MQPTCENCIVHLKRSYLGDPTNTQFLICERLREMGACLVQNSQRVIVVVAPETAAREVMALVDAGGQPYFRNERGR